MAAGIGILIALLFLAGAFTPRRTRVRPGTYVGGGLTYLGPAPKPDPTKCRVCGAAATIGQRMPPWPGTTYAHETYVCDDHESYLEGHDIDHECASCHGIYGACGCPLQGAAMGFLAWQRSAHTWRLTTPEAS